MTERSHSSSSDEVPDLPHRRAWQVAFLVLALIPTISSILALAVGVARFDVDPVDPALDSTYRYFGGIYLGVALLVLWCLPRLEERTHALIFATGAIFLGGVGRLISIAAVGAPGAFTWAVLVIELGAVFLALALHKRVTTSRRQ
ncbi:MAG: DUF4345 domain-containing protein [Actinomycetota bacterium]